MAVGDIVIGIDLSDSLVSVSVGRIDNFNQIQSLTNTSVGLPTNFGRLDPQILSDVVLQAVEQASKEAQFSISSAYVTLPGKYSNVIQVTTTLEKDKVEVINIKDVVTTILDAKNQEVDPSEIVVDIIPDRFVLDDTICVKDPIDKKAQKLTLFGQLVTVKKDYYNYIKGIFKTAGIEIDGFAPKILGDLCFYLPTQESKKDNILLIDIGNTETQIGVFLEGSFVYTNSFDFGYDNVIKDISFVFQIADKESQLLASKYAIALKSYLTNDNTLLLTTCKNPDPAFSKRKTIEIVDIVEQRLTDMFNNIKYDLQASGWFQYIDKVLITGNLDSNIAKIDMLSSDIFGLPTKFAEEKFIGIVDPTYQKSYSLIKYFASKAYTKTVSNTISERENENVLKKILEKVKEFFYS